MAFIRFHLVGISPLLQSNPASMSQPTMGRKIIPTPEEEAKRGRYLTPAGVPYHPSVGFREAILSASVGQKVGKRAARGLFLGGLFTEGELCELYDPETGEPLSADGYEVDTRRCVVERKGILRSRPRWMKWATEITFTYDPELLSKENIQKVLDLAGRVIGVGDYRPNLRGPYGRFKIVDVHVWEE